MIDFEGIGVIEALSPLPSSVDLQSSILPLEPPVKQAVSAINYQPAE